MQSFLENITNNSENIVQKIGDTVDTIMNGLQPPLIKIPPILLLCELLQRPGLSATLLATAIISSLERLGIPTGPNPDGSQNLIVASVVAACSDLVEHLQTHARVDSAGAPSSIAITGTGTAAGIAPVAVSGTNSSFISLQGGIR